MNHPRWSPEGADHGQDTLDLWEYFTSHYDTENFLDGGGGSSVQQGGESATASATPPTEVEASRNMPTLLEHHDSSSSSVVQLSVQIAPSNNALLLPSQSVSFLPPGSQVPTSLVLNPNILPASWTPHPLQQPYVYNNELPAAPNGYPNASSQLPLVHGAQTPNVALTQPTATEAWNNASNGRGSGLSMAFLPFLETHLSVARGYMGGDDSTSSLQDSVANLSIGSDDNEKKVSSIEPSTVVLARASSCDDSNAALESKSVSCNRSSPTVSLNALGVGTVAASRPPPPRKDSATKGNALNRTRQPVVASMVPFDLHSKRCKPLTGYNYYYRDERDNIVHHLQRAGDPLPDPVSDFGAAKLEQLLHQHWYVDSVKGKRRHQKTHGKIEFPKLSKEIAQRWKRLPDEGRAFYRRVARADHDEYDRYLAARSSREKQA